MVLFEKDLCFTCEGTIEINTNDKSYPLRANGEVYIEKFHIYKTASSSSVFLKYKDDYCEMYTLLTHRNIELFKECELTQYVGIRDIPFWDAWRDFEPSYYDYHYAKIFIRGFYLDITIDTIEREYNLYDFILRCLNKRHKISDDVSGFIKISDNPLIFMKKFNFGVKISFKFEE